MEHLVWLICNRRSVLARLMDGPGIENQEDALYALMLVNRRGLQII